MSSFWMPKKQPLYAPMLATLGGGSARGFNPGGGGGPLYLDMTLRAQPASSTTTYYGTTNMTTVYNGFDFGSSDAGYFSSPSSFASSGGTGIFTFQMPAGTFNYEIKGAQATAGPEPHTYYGTITFSSPTNVLFLGGINGVSSYGGGGGTFLALGTNYSSVTEGDALLVAGGTGPTYGSFHSGQATQSTMHNTVAAASNRISNSSDKNYDAGAGFLNTYSVSSYGPTPAQHFVQGGSGAPSSACGASMGGFGGAGGGCPGAGGGYVGGHAGGDGNTAGGSAGTSYYNDTYATFTGTNSPANSSAGPSITGYSQQYSGYLRLTGAVA